MNTENYNPSFEKFKEMVLDSIQVHKSIAKYPNPNPIYSTDKTKSEKPNINEIFNKINRFFVKNYKIVLSVIKAKQESKKGNNYKIFNFFLNKKFFFEIIKSFILKIFPFE